MEQHTHRLKTRDETVAAILGVRGKNGNKLSWDKVAEYFDVSKPCVWRLVNESSYNPGIENCEKLGMQHHVEIPACPDCGRGHAVGWCVEKYGEPKKPRVNSKTAKPRRPPWYALPDSYPNPDRLDKVLKGWTNDGMDKSS